MNGAAPGDGLLHAIDHVAVAVRSVEAALAYYTGVLGMPVVHDEVADDPGVRLVYLDAGPVTFQLVCPVRPGPVRDFLVEHGEGLHHVCFSVRDIPAVLAALPGQDAVTVFRGGRDRRACFIAGAPPGVRIELTEQDPWW